MSKKSLLIIIVFCLGLGAILGYNYYQRIFGKAIINEHVLYVYSTDNLVDVKNKLEDYSKNPNTFLWVAAQKELESPKNGRYVLKEGMSNNDLVNMLRAGNQTPLKISFNNQDNLEKALGRIAEQLEVDSLSLFRSFTDSTFLKTNKFNKKSVLQILIPNTYEFYWTVSADAFRDRMLKEYNRFWNTNRLAKAKKLNLTKNDVVTLASIVQKETAKVEERPIVAGLYLNRLKRGMPLQADPTVIYTIKEVKGQDFVVKRVLNKDLKIISPYNTYLNRGLPPTQIGMPDISSIDAVLNPKNHNFLYMCADINNIGYHKFAKTLREHNRNAAQYQNWLNNKGVKR